MVVLVVGANGQLGERCTAALASRGQAVRASVRDPQRGEVLRRPGVELVRLDVTDPAQRRNAITGVDTVLVTANSVVPRAGDHPSQMDRSLHDLIDDAEAAGVLLFVLPSVPVTKVDAHVPYVRARRELEQRLAGSSMSSWVLRFPPFMECWFALVGSSVPLRGEIFPTIGRPSPFLGKFRRRTGTLVEQRGLMLVPGSPNNRNAFISIRDAAVACVEACGRPEAGPQSQQVAGPDVLSWRQVADLYADILHRRVRILATPGWVYAIAAAALRPVAEVPSRTMALNRYLAVTETAWSEPGGGLVDPALMMTAERFLQAKSALPA